MEQRHHCSLKPHRVLILRSIPQLLQSRNYVITFKLQGCISRYATCHGDKCLLACCLWYSFRIRCHICVIPVVSDKAFAGLPFRVPGKGTLKVQRKTQRETEKGESLQILKSEWSARIRAARGGKDSLLSATSLYFKMRDEMSVEDGQIFKGKRES